MTQRQIDATVSQRLAQGQSLYVLDEALLQQLRPDLVVTQDLCQVCAPAGKQLTEALAALRPPPKVLALSPHTLGDVLQNILEVGRLTGRIAAAHLLVQHCRERLGAIRAAIPPSAVAPRVFFMEWTDPIYCGGHWIAEMIELAGGVDALARAGEDSVRLSWEQVTHWAPEVLIIAPCGCDSVQALEQLPALAGRPGWSTLPAVERNQVYCVDANSYFACPGPRLFEGIELLARLIHPERFAWRGPEDAFRPLPPQRQA
jgi:iron complex transport system substrate-binding protein